MKLVKQVRRVADLGPAVEEALVVAREGVPGPVFVECPVDLLYDEKLIRGWYEDAAGKGTLDSRPVDALVSCPPREPDVRRQRPALAAGREERRQRPTRASGQ